MAPTNESDFRKAHQMNKVPKVQWTAPKIIIINVEPEGAIGSGADGNQDGMPATRAS